MRTFGIFQFLGVLLFLISCSEKTNHYNGFSETITVVTRQSDFDTALLKYPYRVGISGSSLFVSDLHGGEYFCHEFTYPPVKYVTPFAKRGKGPLEQMNVINIAFNSEGILLMWDDAARKIYAYQDGQISMVTEMPEEIPFGTDFTILNDSVFIFSDYLGESRAIIAGVDGKIIRRIGSIPDKEQVLIPVTALGRAWRSFIHCNPRNGILVLVTQFGEVLEIHNLKTNGEKIVVGPGGEPKYQFRDGRVRMNGIMGYGDVFVGDQYIYAIFWGHEFEKINNKEITEEGGHFIHVFDLEGNPVRQYELDCYITGFYVNEATGEVIGTDVNNSQLVIFSL